MPGPRPGWLQPITQGVLAAFPWAWLADVHDSPVLLGLAVVIGASTALAIRFYGTTAAWRGRSEALERPVAWPLMCGVCGALLGDSDALGAHLPAHTLGEYQAAARAALRDEEGPPAS